MKTLFIFSFVIAASLNVFPQAAQKGRAVRFTSVYTDLAKDCKSVEQEAEAIKCRPVGGYRVIAGYGAVTENVLVETVDEKISIALSPAKDNFTPRNYGVIEWRLANGKPFAVIARFTFYDLNKVVETAGGDGKTPFRKEFETGEVLIIKGLKNFERIDFQINPKTESNVNRKARNLADAGYKK